MTDEEVAWCAGWFDGEGHIEIAERHGRRRVRLNMSLTDLDVLERLQEVTGAGRINRIKSPSHTLAHYKPAWVWRVADRHDVTRLLEAWSGHFGQRRSAKAAEALKWLLLMDEDLDRVCWCGKPFQAIRGKRYACCGAHTTHWSNVQRGEKAREKRLRELSGFRCEECGVEFVASRRRQRFHSRACYYRWWRREKKRRYVALTSNSPTLSS